MIMNEIQKIAKNENVSVFGAGPASAMADEPVGYRPEDFMSGTKSLISFGLPIPYDVYHAKKYNLENAWRAQNLMYRRLDTIALRFSALLEENGYKAAPIFGCMPLDVNKKSTVVGIINQIRMAEVTGIGVIGKNGLLIHSQYGSRLMLGGLLTTADLPPMCYPVSTETGCPSDCRICSDACPVGAIMPERKKVKIMNCLKYTAQTPVMSRLKFLYLLLRDKKAAARYMSITSLDEHTFHICSKCVSLCPYNGK